MPSIKFQHTARIQVTFGVWINTENLSSRIFQSSCARKTGVFDFHKVILTVKKAVFEKLRPKVVHYRKYENLQ